jgi:3-hydroxybutyryl-CoA dehydrogenase
MKTIAVIGAGTMGTGIAQLAASHGCAVHLIDTDGEAIERSLDAIARRLDRSVEKGMRDAAEREAIRRRIHARTDLSDVEQVELAIETVIEDLGVKQDVMRQLEAETPGTAILATNTSSLSVTDIAQVVGHQSRVVGMHFFNPAYVMPLVEIVPGKATGESTVKAASDIAKSWGKTVVRATDAPGFIVNRIARGFYLEALRLLGEGVAGIDEIDKVMRVHGRFPMGPFEVMDLVGLEVNLATSTSVWDRMGRHPRFEPHAIQQRLVEQGHLGRKSGRGFYLHDERGPIPAYLVDRRSFELTPLLSDAMLIVSMRAGAVDAGSTEPYVLCRILAAIINEAGRVYAEGVAGSDDIDIAMQKGANYPKGPLAWADDIGHRTVRGLLTALNGVVRDGRYEPSQLFADAQ